MRPARRLRVNKGDWMDQLEPLHRAAGKLRHDANNAMMVLASNLELLARTAATDAARRQVGRAEEAATRLDALLRATLGMLGRAPGAEAQAPLPLLREVLPVLRAVLGTRTPVELEGEAPPALIDRAVAEAALLRLALAVAGQGEAGAALRLVLSREAGEAVLVATPPAGAAETFRWPLATP
jgi:hypothetical protein